MNRLFTCDQGGCGLGRLPHLRIDATLPAEAVAAQALDELEDLVPGGGT